MTDTLHLVAAALLAVGMLGVAAFGYGHHRLNRETTGNEALYLKCAVYGPVATTLAWCVAVALEIAARTT